MEQGFKSSFIPKKDVSISSSGRVLGPKDSEKGIIDKIATILFAITVIGWGGLFGYQKYVEASITNIEKEIIDARTRVDSSRVDQFRALGRQVDASKQLLNEHVSIEPLFEIVENVVVPSVQFSEFRLISRASGLDIEVSGSADNFASVEQQEKSFKEAENLIDPRISEISLGGSSNKVSFKVTFSVPKNVMLYTEIVRPIVEAQETILQETEQDGTEVVSESEEDVAIPEDALLEEEFDSLEEELDSI